MEKRKKRSRILIVTLCVAAVILVSIGGLWTASRVAHLLKISRNRAKTKNPEYVQAQMMEYLDDRYHEEFVMKDYYIYGKGSQNVMAMETWPKGKEDNEHLFRVEGRRNDDGKLDFSDSYAYIKLKGEFVKYFEPIMGEYFEDYYCELGFPVPYTRHNLPPDVTVEELLEYQVGEDYPTPELRIFMNPRHKSDLNNMEAFCRIMQTEKFRGDIDVVEPRDEEMFRELVDGTYKIKSNDGLKSYLFTIEDNEIRVEEIE